MVLSLDDLRQFTVARNFFRPTSLKRALHRFGFVQADPIRAPARAQDLILRHRVTNYHAGDLERRYETLDIEEDVFINYGYVTRSLQVLMHPRLKSRSGDDVSRLWSPAQRKKVALLLDFIRQRGAVHPREVDQHFSHGRVTNYWGGSSNATTHLLDAMHYRGLLRVIRREKGIRIYRVHEHEPGAGDEVEQRARIDALVDMLVRIYAPLPGASLGAYVRRLRYAVPQWQTDLTAALQRARERLTQTKAGGVDWYWPNDENALVRDSHNNDTVRLLAPFDPLVHDRARFELLWGWIYRFEAYTPRHKRKLGYYAMPLLWRDRVIGWGNVSLKDAELDFEIGYAGSTPRSRQFKRELDEEIDRMRKFLRPAVSSLKA